MRSMQISWIGIGLAVMLMFYEFAAVWAGAPPDPTYKVPDLGGPRDGPPRAYPNRTVSCKDKSPLEDFLKNAEDLLAYYRQQQAYTRARLENLLKELEQIRSNYGFGEGWGREQQVLTRYQQLFEEARKAAEKLSDLALRIQNLEYSKKRVPEDVRNACGESCSQNLGGPGAGVCR